MYAKMQNGAGNHGLSLHLRENQALSYAKSTWRSLLVRPLKVYHLAWLKSRPHRSEAWLRERMADGFDVHHIDGDSDNHDPANLVLIECSDHMMLHYCGGPGQTVRYLKKAGPRKPRKRKPKMAVKEVAIQPPALPVPPVEEKPFDADEYERRRCAGDSVQDILGADGADPAPEAQPAEQRASEVWRAQNPNAVAMWSGFPKRTVEQRAISLFEHENPDSLLGWSGLTPWRQRQYLRRIEER